MIRHLDAGAKLLTEQIKDVEKTDLKLNLQEVWLNKTKFSECAGLFLFGRYCFRFLAALPLAYL